MKTIRELREAQGLTQVQLAAKVNVTPSTIYTWEAGRKQPTATRLRALATALGVLMDDIEIVSVDGHDRANGVAHDGNR